MGKFGVFVLLFALFFVPFSSSELSLSQPLDVYNVGDKLYVSASGVRGSDSGNLDIDLLCGNVSVSLVRISARAFSFDEDQTYSVPYKVLSAGDLDIVDVNSIVGSCFLSSSLGSSQVSTKEFSVSRDVRVTARLDKSHYDPGESILLSIEAVKANGKFLEGVVEVSNASSFEKVVLGGSVRETIATPDTVEAGKYTFTIRAYDLGDDNEIINQGETSIDYVINQVPSFIKMSLSDEVATPGEPFSVGVEAFDQSGIAMPATVSLRLVSPEEETKELTIQGGEFKELDLAPNASAGIWKLLASFQGVVDEREFEVEEIQKVAFEFEGNSILVVRNIGNTLYNKTIRVTIGGEERELSLRIERGDKRLFNVDGPEGEQEIIVSDGDYEIRQNALLTGRAISVTDLEAPGLFGTYPLLWISILFILGLAVAYFIVRKRPKGRVEALSKQVGKVKDHVAGKIPSKIKSGASESIAFTKKSPEVHSLDMSKSSAEDKSMIDMTLAKRAGTAQSTTTLKGEKHTSAVLSLHISNYSSLNDHAHIELKKIASHAAGSKGLIDAREEYIFLLFSPLVTKTYSNEILAAKAAVTIQEQISAHNKKFTNKFEFNIGVHSGDLVVSRSQGRTKYTSMGNTISFAKRLSDYTSTKVLVSEEVRKKLLRDLTVEKIGMISDKAVYSITQIKDREQNEAKLKDLLKRM